MIYDFFIKTVEKNRQPKEPKFARVRVFRGTCYGSPALEIEFDFAADGEKVSANFTEGLKNRTSPIEHFAVENFLSEIFEIIEKPEILSGLRHVDVRYHAELEWQNLEFNESKKSGEFKAFSNEWFVDSIESFMNESENADAEFVERMQKILDKKPHRHALEIYSAVKKFSRKFIGFDFS